MGIDLKTIESFKSKFGGMPSILAAAPGRVNLIGEHIDYHYGVVLPMAINFRMLFALKKNTSLKWEIFSIDFDQSFSFDSIEIDNASELWQKYVLGVILEFKKLGHDFPMGVSVAFGSDIPIGSGLSSSAALSVSFAYALNEMFGFQLDKLQLAQLSQRVEHNYLGVQCGIMDMFTSVFAEKNKVLSLDCNTLLYENFDFSTDKFAIVLVNSGVKHSLGDSAYNQRKLESQAALEYLKKNNSTIQTYRDVQKRDLDKIRNLLNDIQYKRALFVIEEMRRVEKFKKFLIQKKIENLGKLLTETHLGLKDLYEVSCEELDFLVEKANEMPFVYGSRMMGGGFGGCMLVFLKPDKKEEFENYISHQYNSKYKIQPEIHNVQTSDGAKLINPNL